MKTQRYTGVAIGLHWLIGLMILGSFGVGLYMVDLSLSPTKLRSVATNAKQMRFATTCFIALKVKRLRTSNG